MQDSVGNHRLDVAKAAVLAGNRPIAESQTGSAHLAGHISEILITFLSSSPSTSSSDVLAG